MVGSVPSCLSPRTAPSWVPGGVRPRTGLLCTISCPRPGLWHAGPPGLPPAYCKSGQGFQPPSLPWGPLIPPLTASGPAPRGFEIFAGAGSPRLIFLPAAHPNVVSGSLLAQVPGSPVSVRPQHPPRHAFLVEEGHAWTAVARAPPGPRGPWVASETRAPCLGFGSRARPLACHPSRQCPLIWVLRATRPPHHVGTPCPLGSGSHLGAVSLPPLPLAPQTPTTSTSSRRTRVSWAWWCAGAPPWCSSARRTAWRPSPTPSSSSRMPSGAEARASAARGLGAALPRITCHRRNGTLLFI